MPQPNAPSLDEIFNGSGSEQDSTQQGAQPQGQKPSLDEIFGQSNQQQDTTDTSVPNLSSLPNQTTPQDMAELNAPELNENINQIKTPDNLTLQDHAALSFMPNDPEGQQNYLQKKYPYVLPDGKGNFMVGNTPGTSKLVNPNSSGNTFFSWLASQADQLAPTAGMVIGSAAGVPGAAAGAAAGTAINKVEASLLGANESPLKMGIDTTISAGFGALGQKAAQMFGVAANKFIVPKLAKAVDGRLTQIVQNGGDPSKLINFVSKAVHFASGANAEDVATLMKYGVDKSLRDTTVNSKGAIVNIAQDLIKATKETEANLGSEVGKQELALRKAAGGRNLVQTSPILNYLAKEINGGIGTVSKDGLITLYKKGYSGGAADTQNLSQLLEDLGCKRVNNSTEFDFVNGRQGNQSLSHAQQIASQLGYDLNNPLHQGTIEKAAGMAEGSLAEKLASSGSAERPVYANFQLPSGNSAIKVADAIRIRQGVGELMGLDNKTLSPNMRRIMGNVLYNNNQDLKVPLSGITDQLGKIAEANGVSGYNAANQNYSLFSKSVDSISKRGLNPYEPASIQDYAQNINKKQPIDSKILSDFQEKLGLGGKSIDDLKRYSAIDHLSNFNPNFLRLGFISGTLGELTGSGDMFGGDRLKRAATFGLVGTSMGVKRSLVALESLTKMGSSSLEGLATNSIKNKIGTAVASQYGARILKGLVNNRNSPRR